MIDMLPGHPFGPCYGRHARVRIGAEGPYGTVQSWGVDLVLQSFRHVVAMDCGGEIVADGTFLQPARPHPGWHHEAIVLEGRQ